MNVCQWLYRIAASEEASWGTEAVALAKVAATGIPVAPSFVVSREAYMAYFMLPDLRRSILKALKGVSHKTPALIASASAEIRDIILKTSLPAEIRQPFGAFLDELEAYVLHVKGSGLPLMVLAQKTCAPDALLKTVKTLPEADKLLRQLFALSFSEKALYARLESGESIIPAPMATLVSYSPAPDLEGYVQNYDFQTHDDSVLGIVIQPGKSKHLGTDQFRVDTKTLLLLSKEEGEHRFAVHHDGQHKTHKSGGSTLEEEEVIRLARLVRKAATAFLEPHRFNWSMRNRQIEITRVINISQEVSKAQAPESINTSTDVLPLIMGLSGNLGLAYGPVRRVTKKAERELVKDGDIIVTESLTQKDNSWLAGAAALIVESGHHASSEGHLAKHLGIPAVLGASAALSELKNGQIVTVNGTCGTVYAGRLTKELPQNTVQAALPITGTKIYAVVDDLLTVERQTLNTADGIGILRSEAILRTLGIHPHDILKKALREEYTDILAEAIERSVRAVYPRPVVYQLHDLTPGFTHGWRAKTHERHEPNPLLGYRGTHRLLQEPELLELELAALSKVDAAVGHTLGLMLPMVRTLEEISSMRRELIARSVPDDLLDNLWVRCETPALTIRAEELAQMELKGVCFDVASLSNLITGLDAENYQVGHHRDQADDAVCQALHYAIAACRQEGVTTSVVAELEPVRPEVIETVVRAGVTAICTPAGDIIPMHSLVASIEQRMLVEHVIGEGETA